MRYPSNKTEDAGYKGYMGILYPSKKQTALIEKTFGCCRYVYNRFLDERQKAYKEHGMSLSYTDQCRELQRMKNSGRTHMPGRCRTKSRSAAKRAKRLS